VRKKWIFIGLAAAIFLMVLMSVIANIMVKTVMQTSHELRPDSWLALDLRGSVREYALYTDDFFTGEDQISVEKIERVLKQAATDDNIRGVVLTSSLVSISGVSLERIGSALDEFRKSGKPVEAYLENAMQKDYWLAVHADRIHMMPSQSAALTFYGLGGSSMFYKDALAKLGIQVHVYQMGESKGAGEMYERTSFSEPFRRNLGRVLDGMYASLLQSIANRRFNGDVEPVRRIFEDREYLFITPDEALAWGLVDTLQYAEEFHESLGADEKHMLDWSDYELNDDMSFSDGVAVVYAQGAIQPGEFSWGQTFISYEEMSEVLDDIEKDDDIRAVVLRVDSPGGSAYVSEQILHRLERLHAKKPVVVSMGGTAASGGYYISCLADSIFAEPFTITGSIGVISMMPDLSGLADKVGLHTDQISRGKYAGALNLWKPYNPAVGESFRIHGERVYNEFKGHVAAGRHMTPEQVEEIAQGKLYTGAQGVEAGLVDRVGGLTEAVAAAAHLAGMESWQVEVFPHQTSLIESFIRRGLKLRERAQASPLDALPPELAVLLRLCRTEPALMLSPVMCSAIWDTADETVPLEKMLD